MHACVRVACALCSDKPSGRLALCFELMDMNIYELIRNRKTYVPENKIKLFMFQVLKSVDHMHRNGIFHRDIKPVRTTTPRDSSTGVWV